MKKLFVLAALILGFTVMITTVSAQTKASSDKSTAVQTQKSGNVVDNNHDGICDHQQAKGKSGGCTKFVDKNNDGKCDNCVNGTCSKGNCSGKCAPKGNCGTKGSCNGCGNHDGKGKGACMNGKAVQPEKK